MLQVMYSTNNAGGYFEFRHSNLAGYIVIRNIFKNTKTELQKT